MTTTSAERLLARVAHGDRVAFAELYDRYASAVYGACLRVLREKHAAEDAAQEAFAAIWRHAGGVRRQPRRRRRLDRAGRAQCRARREPPPHAARDGARGRPRRRAAGRPRSSPSRPTRPSGCGSRSRRCPSASAPFWGLPTATGSRRVRLRNISACRSARSRRGRGAASPASPNIWSGRIERPARTRARARCTHAGRGRPAARRSRGAARARARGPRRRPGGRRRPRRGRAPAAQAPRLAAACSGVAAVVAAIAVVPTVLVLRDDGATAPSSSRRGDFAPQQRRHGDSRRARRRQRDDLAARLEDAGARRRQDLRGLARPQGRPPRAGHVPDRRDRQRRRVSLEVPRGEIGGYRWLWVTNEPIGGSETPSERTALWGPLT